MSQVNQDVATLANQSTKRLVTVRFRSGIKRMNSRMKVGLILIGLFIIFGLVMPAFAPYDPVVWNKFPGGLPHSAQHLLGTTDLGQDIFWLLICSVKYSLILGFIVALLATVIGVAVGLLAGFKGGWTDRIITLLTDTFIVTPSLPILVLMAVLMKGRGTLIELALIMVIFNWPWPARQVRSMALSLKEREFINTARFSGANTFEIILFEIIPFTLSWAMANFVNTVLVAVGTESILAIIGLSNMQQATLGTMIYWAMNHQALLSGAWYWIGSPVILLIVLCIALYLLSTGFSDQSKVKRS
jgi:peptide/nickel transport system permease protein